MNFSRLIFFTVIIVLGSLACQEKSVDDEEDRTNQSLSLDTSDRKLSIPGFDTLPIDRSIDYLTGQFDPALRSEFVLLDASHVDRPGMYLRRDTYSYFIKMAEHANRDSVQLVIRSATRNFQQQKDIWERKWRGETLLEDRHDATQIKVQAERARAILRYSSMPGTSRHHWGTDLDLNAFTNKYFEQGDGKKVYEWLQKNAADYGFCQPYTTKEGGVRTGYEEEKWHWSFAPVSSELTLVAASKLRDSDIAGFEGAESAMQIAVVDNYVLGIHADCVAEE